MIKRLSIIAIGVFLAGPVSAAECKAPSNTPIIPDGFVASQDELVAAQQAVKGFQDRNLDFLVCLDKVRAALDTEDAESKAKMLELDMAEDAAIELEKSLAAEFNTARKHFMER